MILQALTDYYRRAELSPPGWELKAIPFFIVLDLDGQVVSVISRADQANPRGSQILVPQSEIRSGKNAWAQPNLLWDHYGFVLGEPKRKPNGDIDPIDSYEKAAKQLGAFVARIQSLLVRYPESRGLASISKFYASGEYKKVFARPDAVEIVRIAGANMTFRLVGEIEPILHEKWVRDIVSTSATADEDAEDFVVPKSAMCLVTGDLAEIARLHPKIYRVCSKPTALAAANSKEAQAYSSYGKDQGFIFPVGKPAVFAYTTALNHLLRKDSPQRIQVGDASTVFWAERDSDFETTVVDIFGDPPKDDPDRSTRAVQAVLNAVHSGKWGSSDENTRFYVLGLAPNAARISIRFYHCVTLGELGQRIAQHIKDLELARGSYDPQYPSLKRLLQTVCLATSSQPFGDIDRLPPNLGGAIVDAIFESENTPYPALWLNAAVGRCRAEQAKKTQQGTQAQNVPYARAAVIKACLNRQIRRTNLSAPDHLHEKEFLPMLDLTNTNPGYLLGRLFAVLERLQETSAGGGGKLNSTIRDKYYGAMASSPGIVFPTLDNLKTSHLKKLPWAQKEWFDKLIGGILSELPDIPRQLPLPDQGRFALGYYHQRQDFFTKKPDDSIITTASKEGTPA
ncbi:type I-C CRISPR-associated protein Cas8c/Csd1 [Rhodoferax sp. U2-2l]|uniref:type I-C CRISPR-associated protein Cas8c/Csd1 n=1 Tax=Rhodoferax sp. U2-2l TaxID=2884000 RepID=UPI001D09E4A6|nr:type I-C CRISPR-associated protein Cas8c/Csd1 [Rhodoferax sp. U2-2l]MCB8747383.1 type I-C CRISPR-associated protein Cas8c/Csd1 [Rhodoferax sp. U2-2l]